MSVSKPDTVGAVHRPGAKALGALLSAMIVVFVLGVLVAVEAIDLPGHLRTTLGLAEPTPDPPCRRGLYREEPKFPPAPPGRWRFDAPAPAPSVESSSVAVGPLIYTFGGSAPGDLRQVLAYDIRTDHWSEHGEMPFGLNHAQATTYRGDVYIAGGYLEGAEATSQFWQYDPEADNWTQLPPMQQPRGGAGAAVIGDRLYVADGAPQTYGVSDPTGPYDSLEYYDFAARRWSYGPDAPFALHHLNATALDGKLYLAGGRTDPERSSEKFFRYDPRSERWEVLPDLPAGAYSSVGIVPAAGKVVVFGGDDELGWKEGDGSVTPTAWAFDPKGSIWRRLPDLTIERHAFGAAVAGGRIYAIGGSYCPGIKPNGPVPTYTVESLPASALRR